MCYQNLCNLYQKKKNFFFWKRIDKEIFAASSLSANVKRENMITSCLGDLTNHVTFRLDKYDNYNERFHHKSPIEII